MTGEVKSEGATLAIGDGTSPESFNTIGGVVGFDNSQTRNVIDATELSSTVREKIAGLLDPGQATFDLKYKPADTYQGSLKTAFDNGTVTNFRLTLTDVSPSRTFSFAAIVTSLGLQTQIDDIARRPVTLDITGAITEA